MPILEFILTHKEFIVILLMLVVLGFEFAYIKSLHLENTALKADNATLTSNLQASNNSIKTLQSSINDQNVAIDKLKAAADEREKENAAAILAAAKKADSYHQQAIDILKLKPQSADKCQSANDLINQEILKNVKK